MMDEFLYFYIPTYCRACDYSVGLFLCYDVATKKRNFSQLNVAVNWTVSITFLVICAWSTHRVYNTNIDYNLTLEIVFAVVLRPLWSVAIAWIIYASTYGYGGFIGLFLSLLLFLPLSRLSYRMYLVHMVIQAAKISTEQSPVRFTDFLFSYFWADLFISTMVAFVFTLFFESLIIVLEKILTTPGQRQERPGPRKKSVKVEKKPAGEIYIKKTSEV